jgi:predicted MFS family arabinose efflux permease
LRPLRLAMLLEGVALWVPVEKLFMTQLGFDAGLVAVMAAAYAAVVPIMEVPSGILADRWRRRGVLMLANVAGLVSVVVGSLSQNVVTYIASAMILGIYFAMQSGTLEAAVYETILEVTGTSDEFENRLGRIHFANSMALVISALAGGWIATVLSPRATYLLTVPFIIASIIALLRFQEPRLHKPAESGGMKDHVAMTFRAVLGRKSLLPLVALMAVSSMLLQMIFEFGPLWLVAFHEPAALYGPVTAGLVSALGFGGLLAGRLRFEQPAVVTLVVAMMLGCGVILVGSSSIGLVVAAQVVLALLLVTTGIFVTRLLHDATPSTIRSGVASGVSTLSWMAFLPVSLLFGEISNHYGLRNAGWVVIALTALAAVLLGNVARQARHAGPSPDPIAALVPAQG